MLPGYTLELNMAKSHTAYICVGSNLGSKLENCRQGVAELARGAASRLVGQSMVYQTEPVDYKDQDWFVNYVVKIETVLEPLALLDRLKSIEDDAGRIQDSVRFGPRVLDLDIIFYDEMVMDHPRLVIPHPRMHKRRFVLKAVCDIDPHIIHPVFHRTVQLLLEDLDETGQRIAEYK
jgi:2-amino-4-hydroxy-6-hydroxymethyldihydropteridine diphosphokinase